MWRYDSWARNKEIAMQQSTNLLDNRLTIEVKYKERKVEAIDIVALDEESKNCIAKSKN